MFVWDRPPAFQGKITESEIESSPHSCKKVTLPPPLTLKFLLHLCLMSHARVELYVVPSLNTQSCIRRLLVISLNQNSTTNETSMSAIKVRKKIEVK